MYQLQFHTKGHKPSNWSVFYRTDSEKEIYKLLSTKLEEKLSKGYHKTIDQFRIAIVQEEVIYTTSKLENEEALQD